MIEDIKYMEAVGCLQYVAQVSRPDIYHSVILLSRFYQNLRKSHWSALKWILRYILLLI